MTAVGSEWAVGSGEWQGEGSSVGYVPIKRASEGRLRRYIQLSNTPIGTICQTGRAGAEGDAILSVAGNAQSQMKFDGDAIASGRQRLLGHPVG